MAATLAQEAQYFDGFTVLPGERRLLVNGTPAKIGARAFDLLLVLMAARDRVISKDELLEQVWPGLVVEENNLSVHVSQLRKLCGPAAVSTVPGRGYQFTARSLERHTAKVSRPAPEEAGPCAVSRCASRGNLPRHLPALIGRECELSELRQMMLTHRWVTITGASGVGKTRLAEAIGHDLADGMPCWVVELASLSDARFVPNAVAQALGASIVDTEQPHDAIVAALQAEPALLLLDNCEHLVPAAATLCERLLRDLPLLHVLTTSQERLRASGETVYKLNPLRLPEPGDPRAAEAGAVQLLLTRVRALARHFEITPANLEDAVVICQQLDGVPLAIELAAGRVPLLGLAGVRERLGELFRLLTGDSRVRLRRHQTLRAALDWSYQLMPPPEQALLRRLGVFAGTFSIEGVRQIAADLNASEWDVLDKLGSLIDKSLVQIREQEPPRYLLLETTRAYALEQLAATGETNDALDRHARATHQVCRLATRRRDTQAIWDEVANVRAAFAWAMRTDDAELAIGLVNDSSVVLALGGLVGEVVQRLADAEPCITEQTPRTLAAQYWQWLGRFGNDGRLPGQRCVAALEKAESLYRQLSNHRHVHGCLRMRAEALVELGELDAASQALQAAREIEAVGGPAADRMRRLRIEAKVLSARGEFDRAVARLDEALEMARIADIHRYVATLTQDIGQTLLHAGNAVGAEVRFRAVLDDRRHDLSVALALAYARIGLAAALLVQGRLDQARAVAVDAIPHLRSCGILLAHAEVYAWLLAALENKRCAVILLCTANAFRNASQVTRGPLQQRACMEAQALLGSPWPAAEDPCDPVLTDGGLAPLLTTALA